ncbi:MAG: protein translocase subunit SecD [Erysipelotrichaceae bacterium]|nr:protein translocase subunit SecD [Erysipelotrichaceae bacterium]MDY4810122.1 protein translocase subunit SecD [Bulleidia sp.]
MDKKTKIRKGPLGLIGLVIVVIGIVTATTFSTIKDNLNLGLDLRGGFEILYEVEPLNEGASMDMNAVINSISKRINVLGVSEPSISVEGDNRVRVQLAGVADQDTAREMIGTTANLTFRDVDDNELADSSILSEGGATLAYDENGQPVVSLKIKDSEKFGEITKEISGKSSGENIMIIWLDYTEGESYKAEAAKANQGEEPAYISAATVSSQITGDCQISGRFTEDEARTLANLINSGSLPVKMTEISSNVVSAEFGSDALEKTAMAGMIGVALIALFLIIRYRVPGMLAAIMLVAYLWAVFGLYSAIGAVFTLSGIGALVLGVGMTVDVNIIYFERIRQELYKGHSVPNAISQGQTVSFSAIFDSQFTTLITALIMYIWGTGSVKGFATMLIVTVAMTMVINVCLSRFLMNRLSASHICDTHPEWFGVRKSQMPDLSKGENQFYTGTRNLNYTGISKKIITVAVIIIAAAAGMSIFQTVSGNGPVNLGIDFSSGTKLTVVSETALTTDQVQAEMEKLGYDDFSYQSAGDNTVYAITKDSIETSELTQLKADLEKTFGIEPGDNVVTPVVGRDLVRNAVILTLVAWIAMLAYITIRYEFDYAIGCLSALIHDVLIVLSFFAIFRMEVNTDLVSVLLTIIGYSINNSIIVFDRIRENMEGRNASTMRAEEYDAVVNTSVDQTFNMMINGSLTTLLPVILLLLIGSRSIFTFNIAMFVGLIAGTFSSIFVAPTIWRTLRKKGKSTSPKQKKTKTEKKEILDEYTIKGINA